MDTGELIFIIFSSIAALNALFLAVYFWIQREKNAIPNILLSAFIIMGAFRIIKLLLLDIQEEFRIHIPLLIISIPTITLVGPLLYFYIRSVSEKGFKFRWFDTAHTFPFIIIIIFNLFIIPVIDIQSIPGLNSIISYSIISFILLQLVFYLIFSFNYTHRLIITYKLGYSQKEMINAYWLRNIVITIFFLWIIVALYLISTVIKINIYATTIETFFYSIMIYVMLYIELRNKRLTTINNFISKVRTSNLPVQEILRYRSLLIDFMKEKEIYKDHNITLSGLARELSMTTHLLSQIINEQFSCNFNDFINSYRVEEAKKMLNEPGMKNLTVASIAYDSGFNTLSAFNTAFKKFTGLTPSQFRSKHY